MALNIDFTGADPTKSGEPVVEIRLSESGEYLRSLTPSAWKHSSYGLTGENHIKTFDDLETTVAGLLAASARRCDPLVIVCGDQHARRYVLSPGSGSTTLRIS